MSKKHKKSSGANGRALSELENMKHKDLQRACIVRGLPFEEVVAATTPGLSNWFVNNYQRGQNPSLLNEYDGFIAHQLKLRGYKEGDAILSPQLRLGYIGEINQDTGEAIIKRPKGIKKPGKKKRERNEVTGLFSGTKKDLTFQCRREGKTLAETWEIVTAQFPDAVMKSVRIWFNRAAKK